MRIPLSLIFAFVPLLLFTAPVAAQGINLGFEEANADEDGRPHGWTVVTRGVELTFDTIRVEGAKSLRGEAGPDAQYAVVKQTLAARDFIGRRVRLSGHIRTEGVYGGAPVLWVRIDGPEEQMIALDNLRGGGPSGSTDWARYTAELFNPMKRRRS